MTDKTATVYTLKLAERSPLPVLAALRDRFRTPWWISILRFETPSRKPYCYLKIRVRGTLLDTADKELEAWKRDTHEGPRLLDYTRKVESLRKAKEIPI